MGRKCSEPLCSIDDSGGVFKFFQFPSDVTVRKEWLMRMSGLPDGNFQVEEELFLCEVHFDSDSWDSQCEVQTLKESAVPSIFQHNFLLVYINVVHQKLYSLNIHTKVGDDGMLAIEKLKAEGMLEDAEVQKELLIFSNLMVTSALQMVRIEQKSALLAAVEHENVNLSKEVDELANV